MPERHVVLRSGIRLDRPWWYSTKLGVVVVVALAAAYVVHTTLL